MCEGVFENPGLFEIIGPLLIKLVFCASWSKTCPCFNEGSGALSVPCCTLQAALLLPHLACHSLVARTP
jgi:hypothetical protein